MFPFAPTVVEAPYLYRLASSLGIRVIVESAMTGDKRPLMNCHPGSLQYKDKYKCVVPDGQMKKIEEFMNETTRFVGTLSLSMRVSNQVKAGDFLSIGGHSFFKMQTDDFAIQVKPEDVVNRVDAHPVLEIFDVDHSLSKSAMT